MTTAATPLLELRNLSKDFLGARAGWRRSRAMVRAVNRVSLEVGAGETLALIGESGCGKTTLARTAARLYAPSGGTILYRGDDVGRLRGAALRPFRRGVQMIFQDPYGSLDPRMSVGAIIEEPLRIHDLGAPRARRQRVAEVMTAVGLRPEQANSFPHQFSGGQRQRIGIARALAPEPRLIIADEPVSALDVSIQSQILNLMRGLGRDHGLAYLFISHDLAVVDFIADRVAVMYLGAIVEIGARAGLVTRPRHPYTQALRAAVPVPGRGKRRSGDALAGDVPDPSRPPRGCPFHPRCPKAAEVCRAANPELDPVPGAPDHQVACHFK